MSIYNGQQNQNKWNPTSAKFEMWFSALKKLLQIITFKVVYIKIGHKKKSYCEKSNLFSIVYLFLITESFGGMTITFDKTACKNSCNGMNCI